MRTVFTFGLVGTLAATSQCDEDENPPLALAHAPVHYQDTDDTNALADELTAIDYDGNWVTTENWDHLGDSATWTTGTHAVVYRSVVETCTHWFIVYMMYHPRDWSDNDVIPDQEHENDAEGMLVVVTKDGTTNGRVDGMVTVAHNDFYSFVPAGSAWTDGVEDIDGTLSFATVDGALHPMTSQEAKGHGLKAWPYAGDFSWAPGEDGITYVPGTVSEEPPSGDSRDVHYTLVNLFDAVWFLQLTDSAPFDSNWGKLDGDESGSCGDGIILTCSEDSANMPWSWDDSDDDLSAGMLALDPATLVDVYFDGLGNFSRSYVSNKYLEDLRQSGYSDTFVPAGFPSDLSLDEAYTHLDAVCP